VPDKIARLVYMAAMKSIHLKRTDDEVESVKKLLKMQSVFSNGSHMVVTDDGVWVDSNDYKTVIGKGLPNRVMALPSVRYFDQKGKEKVSSGGVYGRLLDGRNLSDLGYHPLHVLHGVDMWEGMLSHDPTMDDGRIRIVSSAHPPFRKAHPGCTLAKAKDHIANQFPGINFDYLDLCLYAKAFAQRGMTEPPVVYAIGQSSSGKTHTWHLGCEIGLCPASLVRFSKDEERFAQQIASAARRSDIVIIDEMTKNPNVLSLINGILLSLKQGMPYHEMYVGPREVKSFPAILLSDTAVLPSIREDVQTARRTILADLGSGCVGKDWRTTCITGNIIGWRAGCQGYNVMAADTYLADIMERVKHFSTFQAAAQSLGFFPLTQVDDGYDPNVDLRQLFRAVCQAKELPESEKRTKSWYTNFKGPGWIVLHRDDDRSNPVMREWVKCVGEEGQYKQRVSAAQWGELVGVQNVEVDAHYRGRVWGIRFRLGRTGKGAGAKYNAAIGVDLSNW
jgi:hypothetical protein